MTRDIFDILLGRLRKGDNLQWFIATTTRGKSWFYEIIKEEGLLDIFDKNTRLVSNDYLKVIRAVIDESPFLTKEYIQDLRKQYTSKLQAQELEALIIEDEGEILSPSWLRVMNLPYPTTGVRYWDLAVSTKDAADNSAGCLMTKASNKFNVINIKRVKLAYPDLKKLIIDTAHSDGVGVTIYIEEAGQQRAIIDDLRASPDLYRHVIKAHRPTKDKVTRCYPLASQAELGNVYVNDEPWLKDLKDELSVFSVESVAKGNTKNDMVDSMTGAYHCLAKSSTIQFGNI